MLPLTPLGRCSPLSLGPECGHCPAGHGATAHPQLQSHWESPTGAPRAGDRPGLQGEPRWLPGTRSLGFEREPKAPLFPAHIKGETSVLLPGQLLLSWKLSRLPWPQVWAGLGWAGSPHAHPLQTLLGCSKAPLSHPKPSPCSTDILLGHRRRRKILPCRGTGGAAWKGSSPAQDPQGTPKHCPQEHKVGAELTASPEPGQEGPTCGCSCPSTTLLCSSPLPGP